MRIGLVAPPWLPVPPLLYGGTEAVVDLLARGLAHRGHDVLLYTVGTSTCPVHREHLYDDGATPLGNAVLEAAHVMAAYDALAEFGAEVIHDHTVLGPLVGPRAAGSSVPVVVTQHGPFTPEVRRVFRAVCATGAALVAISRDHAARAGDLPVAAVIPHAIDLQAYRPGQPAAGPPYLAFVGRMAPEKGVEQAIRIAARAGLPLRISVKMREPAEVEYYESVVRPLLPDAGPPLELPFEARIAMVSGALALLNPIEWPEPFGLVMAEALALGTPVVAYRRGAAAEIVDDGVTGFLVDDPDEAVAAVRRVGRIDRSRCRLAAERKFSPVRFVEDHERLYRTLLERRAVTAAISPAPGPVPRVRSA
jgi:glycosyltransferase involved in cell wall biosynthesis